MRCVRVFLYFSLFSLLALLAACQQRKEPVLPLIYLLNHGPWTPSLVINFPLEAAPLDEVGKPPAKPPLLSLPLEGQWLWQDASRLVFSPRYRTFQPDMRLAIDMEALRLREGLELRNPKLSYQTPPLKIVHQECRFRDILEAPMRRVFEAQLDFNYPLFYPEGAAKLGDAAPPLQSQSGTRIVISSKPLVRPASDGNLDFKLAAGEFDLLVKDTDLRYAPGEKAALAQGMDCQLAVSRSAWDKIEEKPPTPPTVTGFRLDMEEGQLRVRLEGRDLVESAKKVSAGQEAKAGVDIAPPVPGRWVFGESQAGTDLAFTPVNPEALKPGITYKVTLSAAAFPGLVFERPSYKEEYTTQPMSVSVQDFQLYSDPADPKIKRLTARLAFPYPPDKDSLSARVSVDMSQFPKYSDTHSLGYDIVYDDKNPLLAYLKTVPIQIPDEPGRAWLNVGAGLVSRLGGASTLTGTNSNLEIPSAKEFFKLKEANAETAIKPDGDIERLLIVSTTTPALRPQALAESAEGFVLPDCHSENLERPPLCENKSVEEWVSADQVDAETLKLSTPFKLAWRDAGLDDKTVQYLTFTAPEKRQVFVRFKPGIESVDGFKLAKEARFLVTLGENQKELKILHDGALLSLTGSKKLGVAVRGVGQVAVKLQRVLPHNMHHLAQFSRGDFQKPEFRLPIEHFAETFSYEETLPPGKAMQRQYFAVDFARFAQKQGYPPRGLFLLSVAEKLAKPEAEENPCGEEPSPQEVSETGQEPQDGCEESVTAEQQAAEEGQAEGEAEEEAAPEEEAETGNQDQRLVLLTDLGLLVKTAADGHQDVFVMSFRSGQPVAGAQVSLLGMNGVALASGKTDAQGRAVFPSVQGLKDEKKPSVYLAEKDGDLSFLPYSRDNRLLDVSRFDVDGLRDAADSLHAFLFSDRGIYRPGDTAHIGLILRKRDWSALPAGLPLKAVITDPEDQEIWQKTLAFGPEGFEEIAWDSPAAGKTGSYRVELFLAEPADKDKKGKKAEKKSLGATTIRVEEFQPDRLQVKTELKDAPATGWLKPDAAKAKVTVRNLFGTAAAGNKVGLELTVRPWLGRIKGFEDFRFRGSLATEIPKIPQDLGEAVTNEAGEASFDLPLASIDEPIYEITVAGEGFEKDSGRSVVNVASGLVSRNAFLLGYAPDGPLDYIAKGTARKLKLMSLGPDFKPQAVETVSAQVFERRYVSTLVKREDGLYAYQSTAREEPRKAENFALAQGKAEFSLPTDSPGQFFVVFKDAQGAELNRVDYTVAGEGNVSRDIERNAELALSLDKQEYEPGETIQLQIVAPYEGAGLITIEQDGVVASQWFKAIGTASTHRISLPPGLSGNAYLQVAFVRSLDSREIYMSPLSYGVASFAISRKAFTGDVALTVPDKVQPGGNLEVRYRVKEPTRLVLYAVDEGILQFAHYRNPAPLDFFFRKRALQTKTHQILDLILPDYALVQKLSAPGGDEDAETFGKYKNPFARKHKAPLAFWSGLVQAAPGEHVLSIPVPDYFNGSIRVLAVAVNAGRLAVSASQSVASNPFVIQPQQPYVVAPGDEFDMGVLVANATGEEGEKKLEVSVEANDALTLDSPKQTLTLGPGKDATVRFKAKATERLGPVAVRYLVSGEGRQAAYSEELSIRPSQPLLTTLQNGVLRIVEQQAGKTARLNFQRTVFDEQRLAELSVSMTPLAFLRGIAEYLKNYPYGCTEQVVSQAFPAVALGSNPELGLKPEDVGRLYQRTLKILQARQKYDGSFAYWTVAGPAQPFYSLYATHWLLEARERGMAVPDGMLERALAYADQYTQEKHYPWIDRQTQAYGLYLLARNGQNVAERLKAFESDIGTNWAAGGYWGNWARFFLGAAYKLHHLDADADRHFGEFQRQWKKTGQLPWELQNQPDSMSLYLYLANKHFPDLLDTQDPAFGRYLLDLGQDSVKKRTTSFQGSWAMLGLGSLWERFAKEEGKSYSVKAGQPLVPLELDGKTVKRTRLARTQAPVELGGDGLFNLYYQLAETGYDKTAPAKAINQLLTINQWLLDGEGREITELGLQDKLHIRLVLHPDKPMENIAVVMLIPGGFEIDLSEAGLASRKSLPIKDKPLWEPDYIDVQEDRVVLFGALQNGEAYFEFRLKPLNTGTYTVPPVFAEGMYDTDILHRGVAGKIRVRE